MTEKDKEINELRREVARLEKEITCLQELVAGLKNQVINAHGHGHWISDEDGNISCSVCGRSGIGDAWCEHCGARMQ